MPICQACERNPIKVIEPCDDEIYPYSLCQPCHKRLLERALRPLEYFNLTAKHGVKYLLHDDFYDENGYACQPETEVEEESSLSFPILHKIKQDVERVIDYAIVSWWLTEEIIELLKQFDKQVVLESLNRRITAIRTVNYRVYEIAAKVLGEFAADWVRKEWHYRTEDNFTLYADCLAKCLPLAEGFYLITEELNKITSASKLSEQITCLIPFHTNKTLDWIEQNIHRVQTIAQSWGYVAVASAFTWPRAKKWLEMGRPLSLVTLDTLKNCAVTSETMNSSLWLRQNPQRLLEPDGIQNMNKDMEEYLQRDNVYRTREAIGFITAHWEQIIKN